METTLEGSRIPGEIRTKAASPVSNFYAWYCLILLLAIYVNSFLDRTVLGLLVGPIRSTLGLSDTQLGFLMGPAFAIFYTIGGLPLGWLADRVSRLALIGIGQIFWTLSTVAFGMGQSWQHLAIARSCVGVGEASLTPAAYSLIADLFRPERLGRALSIYGMGIYFGSGLASLIGGLLTKTYQLDKPYALGWLGQPFGWQLIFFLVALPTIPLTLLLLTMREPRRRGQLVDPATQVAVNVPFPMFLRYVKEHKGTLAGHMIGFACLALSGYATSSWIPEFFIRRYAWTPAHIGTTLGLATMIIGPCGVLLGGTLGDWLLHRGSTDSKLRVSMFAAIAWLPFGIVGPLLPDGNAAFFCLLPALFLSSMHWGIAPAALQEIMPNQMRGQASALYLLVISLIGLGLGPMALALVTDYVFKNDQNIHYSLLLTTTMATTLGIISLALALPRFRSSRLVFERLMESSKRSE